MAKKFDFKKFKMLLAQNDLKISDFARLAKIPDQTVYGWKRVDEIKSMDAIAAIERILHVKYEDLCVPSDETVDGKTNVKRLDKIHYEPQEYDHEKEWPIVGKTHGGPWVETIEVSEYPGDAEERVPAPEGVKDPNGFALQVEGDSMAPEFPDGCKICVSPNTQPAPGQYAVVIAKTRMGNRESCFKQILYTENSKTLTLRSLNPKYQDIVIPKSDIIRILPVVASEVVTRRSYV